MKRRLGGEYKTGLVKRSRYQRKYIKGKPVFNAIPRNRFLTKGMIGFTRARPYHKQVFKTVSQWSMATAATTSTTHIYGNSLFDPMAGFAGQQPQGFDQYMALYGRYYVQFATVDFIFRNNLDASDVNVVVYNSNYDTALTNVTDALGQPGAVRVKLLPSENEKAMARITRFQHHPGRIHGFPNLKSLDMWGTESSNPNTKTYIKIFAISSSQNFSSGALDVDVVLTQWAILNEQKQLTDVIE